VTAEKHRSAPRDSSRTCLSAAGAPEPCGAVIPTPEIYDFVTGRSQVVTNRLEIFGFNPQPEPPGAPGTVR
jgi:hypothetical protein